MSFLILFSGLFFKPSLAGRSLHIPPRNTTVLHHPILFPGFPVANQNAQKLLGGITAGLSHIKNKGFQ